MVALRNKDNFQTSINNFYDSMVPKGRSELFKKIAQKTYKEKYDEIQNLKHDLNDENISFQTFMYKLNRYHVLSKKLIILVSYEVALTKK